MTNINDSEKLLIAGSGAVPVPAEGGRRDRIKLVKAARRRPSAAWFITLVIVPALVASVYYGLIASPRYVSETQVVVEGEQSISGGMLAMLLGSSGMLPGQSISGLPSLLAEFIVSPTMLKAVDDMVDLRAIYSSPRADYFSRLEQDASREEFLEHFRDSVQVTLDAASGILTIRAEAFSPEDALLIVESLLVVAEENLNSMSLRRQRDSLSFARAESETAEARLKEARAALADFRVRYGEVDPVIAAETKSKIVGGLEARLAKARTELTALATFMQPKSAQVTALKAEVKALEQQIRDERERMMEKGRGTVSARITEYDAVMTELEFARASYTSAQAFYESARATAQQQHAYVVDFVEPYLPEDALRPYRLRAVLTVLIAGFLAWAIGGLLFSAIREQARV